MAGKQTGSDGGPVARPIEMAQYWMNWVQLSLDGALNPDTPRYLADKSPGPQSGMC